MSDGVIKIAIICFTIICCIAMMTRVMTKELKEIEGEQDNGKSKQCKMTTEEFSYLIETVHKAVLSLGYEVGTGYEDDDVIHIILQRGDIDAK